MSQQTRALMLELLGTTCRCGARKTARRTFCVKCYLRLSPPQRRALYRLFGEGYEEAYVDAVASLETEEAVVREAVDSDHPVGEWDFARAREARTVADER